MTLSSQVRELGGVGVHGDQSGFEGDKWDGKSVPNLTGNLEESNRSAEILNI